MIIGLATRVFPSLEGYIRPVQEFLHDIGMYSSSILILIEMVVHIAIVATGLAKPIEKQPPIKFLAYLVNGLGCFALCGMLVSAAVHPTSKQSIWGYVALVAMFVQTMFVLYWRTRTKRISFLSFICFVILIILAEVYNSYYLGSFSVFSMILLGIMCTAYSAFVMYAILIGLKLDSIDES